MNTPKLPDLDQIIRIVPSNMDVGRGSSEGRPSPIINQTFSQAIAQKVRESTNNGLDIVVFLQSVMTGTLKIDRVLSDGSVVQDSPELKDRIAAADRLLDRGFGRIVEKLELTGADGGPIQSQNLNILGGMTREELIALAGPRLAPNLELEEGGPDPESHIEGSK